ncbi:Ig-like domain-containing protein, partial [Lentilactobacillus parabuchneri]
ATNKTLKYSSSDTTVATIDADSGSAKGVKAGSVTITATSVDDTSKTATTAVTVTA